MALVVGLACGVRSTPPTLGALFHLKGSASLACWPASGLATAGSGGERVGESLSGSYHAGPVGAAASQKLYRNAR